MKRLFLFEFILIIFSMFIFSCGDNKEFEVTIKDGYSPSDLTVNTGTVVIWSNRDDKTHTVSSGVPELWTFDSGEIKPGEDFSFEFREEAAGTHIYYCKIHGNEEMEGIIIVQLEDYEQ